MPKKMRKKSLGIAKNYDRPFLQGWWVVVELETRLTVAFFRIKADATRFKKLKSEELQ